MTGWNYSEPDLEFLAELDDWMSAWVGHELFAYDLVTNARPRSIVELGTHTGYSFFTMCQAVKDQGLDCALTAVDTWEGDAHTGPYGASVFDRVQEIAGRHFGDLHVDLLKMTFDEALGRSGEGSIDLLHIDGLHTYEAVSRDFHSWLPKMSPRGIVLLHDTDETGGDFGVYRLWNEIKEAYTTIEFNFAHGLGVAFLDPSVRIELVGEEPDLVRHYAARHAGRLNDALEERFASLEALSRERAATAEVIHLVDELKADLARQLVALESERSAREELTETLGAERSAREELTETLGAERRAFADEKEDLLGYVRSLENGVRERDREIAEQAQQMRLSAEYRFGRAVIRPSRLVMRAPVALGAALVSAAVAAALIAVSLAGRILGSKRRMIAAAAERRTVTAVVTNYNGRQLLEVNLPSVIREVEAAEGRVIVVDDGSDDGSADWLAATHPAVECLALPKNVGLIGACRAGAEAADSDLLLLLNNDVSLGPRFLEPMIRLFEDPTVFSASPHLGQVSRDGADEAVAEGYFPGGHLEVQFPLLHRPDLAAPEPAPVLFACGGAALYDRHMLLELGWDSLYEPYYSEDLDVCYRAWKRGARCLHTGLAVAEHMHQQSIGREADEEQLRALIGRNELLFTWKDVAQLGLTVGHGRWLVRRTLTAFLRRRPDDLRFRAVWRSALRRLPRALAGRFAEARAGSVSDTEVLERSKVGLWEQVVGSQQSEVSGTPEVAG